MRVRSVPSLWLEQKGRRLDCGPYLSGAIEAKVLLEKLPVRKAPLHEVTQGGMAGIFNGPRFSRTYVDDPGYGIPFLGSTDILAADLSWLPLISKKQVVTLPELIIEEGWTLITCSGTIGRMAYARPEMVGMAGSQHFMRVVPDPDKILPGYLYAYLSSRFGMPLVVGGTYGAIIQHIEPHHIADLPVPLFGDEIAATVHRKIDEAARLRDEYQSQVREATRLFFSAVGLKDITSAEWHQQGVDLGFAPNMSSPTSLRALNFNPRFKRLCDKIKAGPWKPLGEICQPGTLQRGGRYKRIDAEAEFGYQLIGQRQLFWQKPEGRSVAKFAIGPEAFVEAGTTLVAAQGTLGESELYCRSEFIWGPAVSLAYSEHMLRVVTNKVVMPGGCLFAFMRSEMAFRMLRSISMGSKLQDHHYTFLPNLLVPYPNQIAQQEIHELIVDAYDKKHRSNALEAEATRLVEQAIDN